jgi:Ca2+-binding RTX toxin-like protein
MTWTIDCRRVRVFAALMAVALCALTYSASANAATSPFGCRASLARVGLANSTILEPIVANNPGTPCAADSDGVQTASVPSVANFLALAGPAAVYTYSSSSQPATTGTVAPGATALASVNGVTIPTPNGSIVIAGPVQATASYECSGGKVTSSGSTTLSVITINGQKITLVPDQGITIPLGNGSYIAVNESLKTATSVTERIADVHIAGLADVVVGEATVSQNSDDPCAGTLGTPPPSLNACPTGSTFDPVNQVCEIVLPGGTVIVIGPPFQEPTGGKVLALSVARRLYHSGCLYGRGPNYAIVGTNRADRINGTRRAERILGLGGRDRIAGQNGSDCIDGGTGNDRIWGGSGATVRAFGGTGNDRISIRNGSALARGGSGNDRIFLGNGNDRAYGDAGNDRIAVGRGNDKIWGGTGNDMLTAGNGDDMVDGGTGNDRVYLGNGRDHIYGDSGNDRLYGRGLVTWMSCGSGRDTAYVNTFAAHYAGRHGCERLRLIRPHQL